MGLETFTSSRGKTDAEPSAEPEATEGDAALAAPSDPLVTMTAHRSRANRSDGGPETHELPAARSAEPEPVAREDADKPPADSQGHPAEDHGDIDVPFDVADTNGHEPSNPGTCQACGAELMHNARFCAMCAWPTNTPARPAPTEEVAASPVPVSESQDATVQDGQADADTLLRTMGPGSAPVVDLLASETDPSGQ